MERGYRVTDIKDASAAIGASDVHDFVMKNEYPMIAHAVISAKDFSDHIESKIKTALNLAISCF